MVGMALMVGILMLACSTADSATLSLHPDDLSPSEAARSAGGGAFDAGRPNEPANAAAFIRPDCDAGCPESLPACLNEVCAECDGAAQCEEDEVCQLSSGLCREPCNADSECSLDEFCGEGGFCVECEADLDCQLTDDAFCSPKGSCVECRSDADCSSADGEFCIPGIYECDDSFPEADDF